MDEMSLADELREAEREALVEEVRLLRQLSPNERLAEFFLLCREGAQIEGVPHDIARRLDERARDAMLDRVDRIINGP